MQHMRATSRADRPEAAATTPNARPIATYPRAVGTAAFIPERKSDTLNSFLNEPLTRRVRGSSYSSNPAKARLGLAILKSQVSKNAFLSHSIAAAKAIIPALSPQRRKGGITTSTSVISSARRSRKP